jgi:hypothetical protein
MEIIVPDAAFHTIASTLEPIRTSWVASLVLVGSVKERAFLVVIVVGLACRV